ncbi:MAG: CPBP family intramembrane glutamic endopeptidase [Halohasta sp.]
MTDETSDRSTDQTPDPPTDRPSDSSTNEPSRSARGQRLQHIGEAILVVLGAYLGAVVVVQTLNPVVASVAGGGTTSTATVILTVIQFVTMMVVVGWYVRVLDVDELIPAFVPGRRAVGLIVAGTVVLLGGQYAVNELLQWAGFSPGANQAVLAGVGDPIYYLVMIPVSLLFVGPAEELLFRGAVQGRLRQSWGRWPAIIGATIIFGLIHIPAISGGLGGQLSYALVAGILGVLLGYLYDYTRNIVVPAVIHGGYNGALFALLYLTEIGYFG